MELLKIKNFPLPIWYYCSLKVCKRQDRFFLFVYLLRITNKNPVISAKSIF